MNMEEQSQNTGMVGCRPGTNIAARRIGDNPVG
jgi:hypothetical protein